MFLVTNLSCCLFLIGRNPCEVEGRVEVGRGACLEIIFEDGKFMTVCSNEEVAFGLKWLLLFFNRGRDY